ncbi:T9SS type A sorting domain-containing protein [Psychroserpens sp. NJDZ02]|uniref:T9SS type A sorting domain-containing protein n=1 Tax=Psychroserpens sp. NJDZ02 TaxID=2570561 RepID=UPI0010A8DDAE|nr:T9SS type A sorting domain-containing protein [Psychroserpens sp. NJDZ02]QCE41210.1 T9SS type A sorting domain-containing protein [Psychroserpens sp. NJDZ02]
MRKTLLFTLLFCITKIYAQITPSSYNNPPDLSNTFTFGGNAIENVIEMQKDDSGNLYVLGNFYGETTIGVNTLSSVGSHSDIFLAKFDSSGNMLWITQSNSISLGNVDAFQFIINNNTIFVVGQFKDTDILSGQILNGAGTESNYFLAKYSTDGTLLDHSVIEINDAFIDNKVTPRLTMDTNNNSIYVALINRIYNFNSDLELTTISKVLDPYTHISDITFFNDAIYLTGNLNRQTTIDGITLNNTGYYFSLFYASLDLNLTANWAFVNEHAQTYRSDSGFGKFNIKENQLFLAGMLNQAGTLNNQSHNEPTLGAYVFLANINETTGNIDSFNALTQDIYFISHENFEKITFLYDDNVGAKSVTLLTSFGQKVLHRYIENQSTQYTYSALENNDTPLFSLNDEETVAFVNSTNLHLTINKIQAGSELWNREFVSENDTGSKVMDIVSDKENYYYALIVNGRKTNNRFGVNKYNLIKADFNNIIIWSLPLKTNNLYLDNQEQKLLSYSNGKVFLGGNFSNDLIIDNQTITPQVYGGKNQFLTKFSSEGILENYYSFDYSNSTFGDVTVLNNGKVVITTVNNNFAKAILLNSDLTINNEALIEIDPSYGSIFNLSTASGINNTTYLVGEISGNIVTYNSVVFNKPESDNTQNGSNVFFELDSNFNFTDVFNFGHSPTFYGSWPSSIVSDGNGNKYISGTAIYSQDFNFNNITPEFDSRAPNRNSYYAKINSNNDFEWVKTIGSPAFITNYSRIDIDEQGNLYASGLLKDKLFIDETIELDLSYENGNNAYIIKYSSTGALEWVKTFASSKENFPHAIAAKNNGQIVIGGYIKGETYFDQSNSTKSINVTNGFLTVIDTNNTLNITENSFSNSFSIYPNPSNGIITLDTSLNSINKEKVYVQVYDLLGKIVYSKIHNLNINNQINLKTEALGMYIVKINDGIKTYSSKLILD